MLLNILYFILFSLAVYDGVSKGLKKMRDTEAGLIPPCKPDNSNDYFFLVYHD